MTWTDAQNPSSWGCVRIVTLSSCSNVNIATVAGVDTGTEFYYDPASGALYRIEDYSANFGGSQSCAAGSGRIETCDDPNAQHLDVCTP